MTHLDNGILFGNKREWNTDRCHNTDESQLCSVKEASHKRPHTAWFNLYELSKIGKPTETGNRLVVARVRGRKGIGGEEGEMLNDC